MEAESEITKDYTDTGALGALGIALGVIFGFVGLAALFGALAYYLYRDDSALPLLGGVPINALLGLVFGMISFILVLLWEYDGDDKIQAHYQYMVAMFFTSQVLAILSWSLVSHSAGKIFHVLFQTLGIVGMALGLSKIVQQQLEYKLPQLITLHSWVGIAAVTMFGTNYIWGSSMGILKVCYPDSPLHKAWTLLYMHKMMGLTALGLTLTAIETGIMDLFGSNGCFYDTYNGANGRDVNPGSNYQDLPYECKLGNGLGITVLLATLFVYVSVFDRMSAVKIQAPTMTSPYSLQAVKDSNPESANISISSTNATWQVLSSKRWGGESSKAQEKPSSGHADP